MKILVVDDDPSVRKILRLLAENHGHSVIEAPDGQEGLEKAREYQPDAIISDAVMPRLDGFNFLNALRHEDALANIPFILFTAIYTRDEEYKLARSFGADALIVKPKQPDAFWEEFTAALERHAADKKTSGKARPEGKGEELFRDYCRLVAAKLEENVRELETALEVHEKTKTILKEKEERYRLLFESNPYPMWVYDLETLAFLTVNDAAVYKYGYSRDEFLTMTIKDIRPPEDVPALIDKVSQEPEGLDEAGIWRHLKKDGTMIDVEITSHSMIFEGRRAKLILASDVTKRKQLMDALKAAVVLAEDEKARADSIIAAIGDGITIQDRDFRILYQNQAAKNMVGDHVGELCYRAYEKREQRCEDCPVAMVFEDGKVHTVERSAPTDKGMIYLENTASPLRDSKGNIIAGIEVVHDITKRKKMEEDFEQQKQFADNLIQNSAVATFVLSAQHTVLIWNRACEELTGVPAFEMLGTTAQWRPFCDHEKSVLADIVLSDDPEKLLALHPAYSKSLFKSNGLHAEEWCKNLNGRDRYIMFDAAPIYSPEGKVIAAIETLQDITERKLAEEQVFLAKQDWEETFNTITDMVTIHDKDFNIIHANRAAQKVLGLPFLEMTKVKCFDYYHGTGCPPEGCPSCRSLVTGKESVSEMYEPHLKMFIEISAIPRIDSNNQTVGLIHVVRDISERKKAEDELKEERNRAQKYLDIAGVMLATLDPAGRTTLINKKGLEILGYEEHEVLNQNWFDLCVPDNVREEVKGVFNKLMAGDIELVEYYENPIVIKDGRKLLIAFHNTILRNEAGEISGILFSGEDVTERIQAQNELNERIRQASLGAEVGIALTRGSDLKITLQLCAEAMVRHLEVAFARIWTLKEKENILEMQASSGMYTHIDGAHSRVPVGKFKIGLIAQERKPHLTNQVIGDPRVGDQEWAIKEGMVAFAGYPLIVQDRLVGVMAMFSRRRIPEATMSSLASVADVIALGIERKRTEEMLTSYSKELTSLNMASDTLLLITNLSDIYQEICNIIHTVFDLKMVWLGVIDEGNYEVKPVAYSGHEDGYLSAIKVTWDDSPTGMGPIGMAIKGKTIFKENINDSLFVPWKSEAQKRGYVDIMSVPLIYARDKCLGVLTFYSDSPNYFTPDRVRLCQIFSNQAAIAIENARLIEELEGKVRERTRRLEDANMELHVVNQELVQRRAEADAASRSKTDFLANMSHELRTPLNVIMGFSDIMQTGMAGPVTEKQKEFLNDIYTSGNHLLSLITDILDLSKIEAGKTVLEPETFTVKELLEVSLNMFKEKALKHHIKVTSEIDKALTSITADKRKLKQVMVNLLSNAFKFTPDGGSVRVSARGVKGQGAGVKESQKDETDRDFIEISVTDTGIGISIEHQQRLFQPFQQIETSLTRKYAGTGLGLSLCRRFVELHGGRIWVESEPGKGSRFVFVIPMNTT